MKRAMCGVAVLLSVVVAACGSSGPPGSAGSDCDPAVIGCDLGGTYTVERCYGDWAYIDAGGLGDAQSLARLMNGTWTRYAGFPSTICQSQARADGVPEREVSSFRPC